MRLFVGAALGVVAIAGCGGESGTATGGEYPQWMRSETSDGQTRLSAPLIALNCQVGNAFRCDRIVFSYGLRLPAGGLEAWVAGRRVTGLRTAPYGGEGSHHGESGLTWTGHVQPAGLTEPGAPLQIDPPRPNYWAGEPPVRARVLVVARLKSGETVREIFPFVRLQAGYG
jgi:hypothetical protein